MNAVIASKLDISAGAVINLKHIEDMLKDDESKGNSSSGAFNLVSIVFLSSVIIGIIFHAVNSPGSLVARSDLVSFLTGAKIVSEGASEDLYNLDLQYSIQSNIIAPYKRDDILPFKNFAVFSLPFIPLTYLSLKQSYIIFAFFNLVLLGILVYISSNIFTKINKIKYWLLIPFIFLPNILTTLSGQLSIILAFIYLLIYISIQKKNALLTGAITGLLLIKPQFIIVSLFFFLLVSDKKRFFYGLMGSSLVFILASIYLSDIKAILSYPEFLLATENASFLERSQKMFTVSSSLFYNLPLEISYHYALYLNTAFYILIYYLFIKRYKLIEVDLAFVSATLFSLLFAVHVLEHDLSILIVPVFVLLNYSRRKSKFRRKSALLFAILLFFLPLVILMINPLVGTIITLTIAIILLYEGKGIKRVWKTKN